MCNRFVCLLHCAVKSVTCFVYNNAGLKFISTLFCFDCCHYELHCRFTTEYVSFVDHRNAACACVLVCRSGKMSAGQDFQKVLRRKLNIQTT
jgi:hypothetical protein